MTVNELLRVIQSKHTAGTTTFIGIDGCGGAGKTTLAENLKKLDPTISIIHMDEFDMPFSQRLDLPPVKKPIGADSDWKRLAGEVLIPLREGKNADFETYSWDLDRMHGRKIIRPFGIVVVEGVYATRQELADFYSLKIWIDVPKEVRLKRGLARDGEEARDRWLFDWMPMEDRYVKVQKPHLRADIVLREKE
jgi:uridine kinase